MKVILVCIENFQEYILDCIKQLYLVGNKDIDVICNRIFFPKFFEFPGLHLVASEDLKSEKIQQYNQKTHLSHSFRGGFWIHCTSRFFYIYEHMKKNNLRNVIHIENDIMVYTNFDKLSFDESSSIHLVMDANHRCIPSILWIRDSDIMEKYLGTISLNKNDMETLAAFYNSKKYNVNKLPIIDHGPWSNQYDKFNGIFDGAAIGQYLGGVDPKNQGGDTRGFVNETTMIQYDKYKFIWKKLENLYYPYLIDGNKEIPIFNLHIHCKNLIIFLSNDPKETKYITK